MRVTSEDLHGEASVALRDSRTAYELAIDFSHSPECIAEALTEVIQEGVDSHRWTRRDTREHQEDAAAHPASHPEGRY